MNKMITAPSITSDFFNRGLSFTIVSCLIPSSAFTSNFDLNSSLKKNLSMNKEETKVINTVGPNPSINELKSIFAAEPIIMFGGSPIKVAVPPILEHIV